MTLVAINPDVTPAIAGHRGRQVGVPMGRTQRQGLVALPLRRIYREDVSRPCADRSLHRRHADAAEADDRDVLAGPHRRPTGSRRRAR